MNNLEKLTMLKTVSELSGIKDSNNTARIIDGTFNALYVDIPGVDALRLIGLVNDSYRYDEVGDYLLHEDMRLRFINDVFTRMMPPESTFIRDSLLLEN